ncbi:peroxiredoxin family protein [Paractinoplanes rhizophilus]|jgi:peroxiredoxin|uniref:thioredoxin-dependent peroxiredoxin n=1 Tax=Paractinoplanes rhizophilus TaxID=1416877 RepID=A0ABW2HS41_9ACTN|nr:peroxiredoxin family protein [Actinoplanes sp.]
MTLLLPGDTFPQIAVDQLGGGVLRLPEATAGHYGVVLFYRGSWCPYCSAQLRAFQRAAALDEVDARVVALSVDDEPTTRAFADKNKLQFPIGYGADAAAVAKVTGAVVNPDPAYLQSTGFVLDPEGKVMTSVYSSGAIGRLVPDDVVGFIRYAREHAANPAG